MAVCALGRETSYSSATAFSDSPTPGSMSPSSTRSRNVADNASTSDTVRSYLACGISSSPGPMDRSPANAVSAIRDRLAVPLTDTLTFHALFDSWPPRSRTRECRCSTLSTALSRVAPAFGPGRSAAAAGLFLLLGALRWKAWQAGLASLVVALAVAVIGFRMPVGQALFAGGEGAAFGLFPIVWIVLTAIWIFRLTEFTGYDLVLRRAFGALSPDHRVQEVLIAFCFGALLEALAGFGTPVAVRAVMLMALGLRPLKAASVAVVANTAPVAFGAIAVPITTPRQDHRPRPGHHRRDGGRQTPILAVLVPLMLVIMVDGRRGRRGHGGPGERPAPQGDLVEAWHAVRHVRSRVPAVHPGARLDDGDVSR